MKELSRFFSVFVPDVGMVKVERQNSGKAKSEKVKVKR